MIGVTCEVCGRTFINNKHQVLFGCVHLAKTPSMTSILTLEICWGFVSQYWFRWLFSYDNLFLFSILVCWALHVNKLLKLWLVLCCLRSSNNVQRSHIVCIHFELTLIWYNYFLVSESSSWSLLWQSSFISALCILLAISPLMWANSLCSSIIDELCTI